MVPILRPAAAALTALVVGCATEPTGPALQGRFANRHFEATATADSAHLRLPCGSATTTPFRLNGTRVSATGTYYSFSTDPGPSPLSVYGELRGDTLSLYMVRKGPPPDGPHVLHRDSIADFSDIGCLAGQ